MSDISRQAAVQIRIGIQAETKQASELLKILTGISAEQAKLRTSSSRTVTQPPYRQAAVAGPNSASGVPADLRTSGVAAAKRQTGNVGLGGLSGHVDGLGQAASSCKGHVSGLTRSVDSLGLSASRASKQITSPLSSSSSSSVTSDAKAPGTAGGLRSAMRSMASLFGVGGMARGGVVPGVQGITGDNIPALLTKDEFVVSEGPSKKHRALLHAINKGGVAKHFATGGVAGGGSYGATSQVQYTPVYVTNYKDFNFGGNRAKDAMSSAAMGKMPGVGGDMGGGIGSMLGMMGGPIGVVTAGLTALGVGMSKTTELLNINGDRLATQGQKYRSMMESIIPGASIFNNFVDALQGVSGSMRQLKLDMRISETRIAAGASVRAANAGLNTERVQNETTASGMRAHSLGSNQIFNRATEHGQIQSEDFQTRQSARDNYVRAQRTETGARQNQAYHTRRAASLGGNVASLREDYNARRAQRETLQANDTNGDGLHRVRVAEALNKEREAQLRLQTRVNEAVAAEGQARAAGVAAEQATVAARRAALDIARADLDVLNRREQRMSGTAGRLGAMSRGSFRQAERSAARVARRGVERSSESDVQRAAQIDPRLIREQQDRLGERRAQRLVGRQGVGETHNADWQGGANLQNVREQQDTAAQTARDQADRIAVEGAQQVSVAFNEGLNRVFRLLQSGIEDAVARLETQAAMGSNSP